MPDREKVIKHIVNYVNDVDGLTNIQWVFAELDILKDAIALLKAQEPIEPYTKRDGRTTFFLCGGCNKPLCIAKDSYKPKHCPECGSKVKWE